MGFSDWIKFKHYQPWYFDYTSGYTLGFCMPIRLPVALQPQFTCGHVRYVKIEVHSRREVCDLGRLMFVK